MKYTHHGSRRAVSDKLDVRIESKPSSKSRQPTKTIRNTQGTDLRS